MGDNFGTPAIGILSNPVYFSDLIKGVRPPARRAIKDLLTPVKLGPSEEVFRAGCPITELWIHRSGDALLELDLREAGRISRGVFCGEVFGMPEMFLEKCHHCSLSAISECAFDTVDAKRFKSLTMLESPLCFQILRTLSANLNAGKAILRSMGPVA